LGEGLLSSNILHMPAVRRQISHHASQLRRDRTDAEEKFWQAARNRQIDGFKFRFQHSVLPYIADFACLEAMLIVEIDGGQHDEARDARRTAFLESEGFEILRFWNNDVLTNLDGVIQVVRQALIRRTKEE
jgi:very-short-patch-repair endonuclease